MKTYAVETFEDGQYQTHLRIAENIDEAFRLARDFFGAALLQVREVEEVSNQ